jgi:hypothetical protein
LVPGDRLAEALAASASRQVTFGDGDIAKVAQQVRVFTLVVGEAGLAKAREAVAVQLASARVPAAGPLEAHQLRRTAHR